MPESGQRERTVNPLASAYDGSNPSPRTKAYVGSVALTGEQELCKLTVVGSNPIHSTINFPEIQLGADCALEAWFGEVDTHISDHFKRGTL